MAENKQKIIIKKIKAYPLGGELTKGTAKITLAIVHIAVKGFVTEVHKGICQVGVHYECQIKLPTAVMPLHGHVQVVKTYDGVHPKTHKPQRMAEALFVKMPEEEQRKIRSFVVAIGQRE